MYEKRIFSRSILYLPRAGRIDESRTSEWQYLDKKVNPLSRLFSLKRIEHDPHMSRLDGVPDLCFMDVHLNNNLRGLFFIDIVIILLNSQRYTVARKNDHWLSKLFSMSYKHFFFYIFDQNVY